jgi:DNA repair exonuclease SbcCD ATPase subunit
MADKKIKVLFKRLFIIGTLWLSVFAQSCDSYAKENQEKVVKDYAKAACDLYNMQKQKDSVFNLEIKPLEMQFSQLNNEYRQLSSAYIEKLNELDKKKYEAGINADEESARISKTHEALHGHRNTPGYERKMNAIENKKDQLVKDYDQQIKTLTKQKENDKELQGKIVQIEELKNKINTTKKNIQSQFDSKISDYKKQADDAIKELGKISNGLSETEKKTLLQQREKIKANPCSQWK